MAGADGLRASRLVHARLDRPHHRAEGVPTAHPVTDESGSAAARTSVAGRRRRPRSRWAAGSRWRSAVVWCCTSAPRRRSLVRPRPTKAANVIVQRLGVPDDHRVYRAHLPTSTHSLRAFLNSLSRSALPRRRVTAPHDPNSPAQQAASPERRTDLLLCARTAHPRTTRRHTPSTAADLGSCRGQGRGRTADLTVFS
jgi:hypothetical protein